MNLQIPEGANVHIMIGSGPALALTDQRAELPARSRSRGILGATFKVGLVCLLVIGSFWIGEQRGQGADDDAGIGAPPPITQAFPSQAAAAEPPAPSAAGQVPPSFTAQLQQQPTIQPAPGQTPASGTGSQNAFGLDNQ